MYLSTKLEETPRKVRSIIGVLDYLERERNGKPFQPIDVSSPNYFDTRQGLLESEARILGKLGFEVHVEHPHGFMINYMQSLELSSHPVFPQKAWNYLNDSYKTISCVLYQPHVIACAIIHLTSRMLNLKLPTSPPWWIVFDGELEDIEFICELILALYTVKIPQRVPDRMVAPISRST